MATDYDAVLALFRDKYTQDLTDRQVAALTLVARRNAGGCVVERR